MSTEAATLEALQKREAEQEQLIAITNALIAEVEPQTLFQTIADQLRSLFPVYGLGIALFDERQQAFERGMMMAEGGVMHSIERLPLADPMISTACVGRSAMLVSPERINPILERFPSIRGAFPPEGGSFVVLPMFSRARNPIALATVIGKLDRPFTDDDLPFLNQLTVQIGLAVENMLAYREIKQLRMRLEQEGRLLKEEINETFNTSELIYGSAAVANVMRAVEKAASTDATVLLLGETGTGKEMFARTIHALSPRADHVMVKVNCSAIPLGLIESHLFGHEKGAFTGAVSQHLGVFEVADQGTIFLDEVGDLPLETQVKLLRVLQEGEFNRVGGTESFRVDVRVIAATNRPIDRMVAEGVFRADLYYRLAVIPILIPALRDRPEDISLLATYFVNKYAMKYRRPVKALTPEALAALSAYSFPGNVRELENMIERAAVLCDSDTVDVRYFHFPGRAVTSPETPGQVPAAVNEDDERTRILRILHEANWLIEGKRGAAARLGLKPSTLRSRMSRLGIRREER